VEVRHIGRHVLGMLHDALDAFARLDSEQALRIMKADKQVDEEYQAAIRALLTFMMEDPRTISRCMSVMWILRALERVGDHACNIAENVILWLRARMSGMHLWRRRSGLWGVSRYARGQVSACLPPHPNQAFFIVSV
jgi:phosphate uptake regulator